MIQRITDLKTYRYNDATEEKNLKTNLSKIYSNDNGDINGFHLFLANFNRVPNFVHEINIDCKKANKWFKETYKDEIKDMHFTMRYLNDRSKAAELDDIFYLLFEDLIVNFDTKLSRVRFFFKKDDLAIVNPIAKDIRKFKIRNRPQSKLSLIVRDSYGLETKKMDIKKVRLNLEEHYNNNFKEIHIVILKRLSKKDDKGLVLLHGKPGTGKTSYIRHLSSILRKNIIFLPPNMASAITNPELISLLIEKPDSILIIEDAENIVMDREKDGQSPVSAILNLSDGLLSDCLNIQIICSFNTDLSKIDSALMRKGRLIAKYEFNELDLEKSQKLSNKLGFKTEISNPMTLAEIYNQEDINFAPIRKRNTIGFKANS